MMDHFQGPCRGFDCKTSESDSWPLVRNAHHCFRKSASGHEVNIGARFHAFHVWCFSCTDDFMICTCAYRSFPASFAVAFCCKCPSQNWDVRRGPSLALPPTSLIGMPFSPSTPQPKRTPPDLKVKAPPGNWPPPRPPPKSGSSGASGSGPQSSPVPLAEPKPHFKTPPGYISPISQHTGGATAVEASPAHLRPQGCYIDEIIPNAQGYQFADGISMKNAPG